MSKVKHSYILKMAQENVNLAMAQHKLHLSIIKGNLSKQFTSDHLHDYKLKHLSIITYFYFSHLHLLLLQILTAIFIFSILDLPP